MPSDRRAVRVPRWEAVLVALWFVVLTALARLFPRTGDDWAWGSQEGIDRLHRFFQGLNGRYGGNLLVLGLGRAGPWTAVVVAAVLVATLVLVLHLADSRTPLGYGVALALFLAMPLGVRREAVVWLSGFVNYATATVFLLGLLAVARAERSGPARAGVLRLAAVAVTAFVGQLFMEHVSLAVCVLGAALTLLHRRTRGSWPPLTATWTAAAFVGVTVMLSNSAYRNAAAGDAYQSVQRTSGAGALHDLVVKSLDTLPTYAVVENVWLNTAVVALLVLLVVARRALRTAAGALVVVGSLAFLAVSDALWFRARDGVAPERTSMLAAPVAVLLLGVLLLACGTLVRSRARRWTLTASCAAVVLLTGPLMIVNPVGPRCFYPSYVVLLLAAVVLAAELRDAVGALARPAVSLPVHLVAAALVAGLFVVYSSVSDAMDRRVDAVRAAAAAGDHEIRIAPLPHPGSVHDGDPYWSLLAKRFKTYYGIRKDLVVTLSPNPWRRDPGKPPPKPAP